MRLVASRLLGAVLGVVALAFTAGSAWGNSYTSINPPPGGEASHIEIMQAIYGGTWSTDDGINFYNDAGITASRVWDTDGSDEIIHVLLGDETNIDQVWTDGTVTVTAEAKWAEFNQSFGWNGGGTGTNYIELLTEADIGGDPVQIDIMGNFLWGIQPKPGHYSYGYTWWSQQSKNDDGPWGLGKDHMVTYFVEGLADVQLNEAVWLLFWEDYPCAGDEDYNDFVIEVRAIPEPSTALLLAAGLLGFGLRRRFN